MVEFAHAEASGIALPAFARWQDSLRDAYAGADIDAFEATYTFLSEHAVDTRTADGESLAERGLGTATILSSLSLDPGTIHAALLMPLAQARIVDAEAIAAQFGHDVAGLVAGVTRMDDIRATPENVAPAQREIQVENLRKMLLAMVEDIRVVLIKLAERTQALRFLGDADESLRR
ncbi:MAG: HD domain-containing protein, partial [Casimicrobiaceae bacterium]